MTRLVLFFFFNDTATTEIYTLSLHDALPISYSRHFRPSCAKPRRPVASGAGTIELLAAAPDGEGHGNVPSRSEEHTSELQSRLHLVCRLLLEKKKAIQQSAVYLPIASSVHQV